MIGWEEIKESISRIDIKKTMVRALGYDPNCPFSLNQAGIKHYELLQQHTALGQKYGSLEVLQSNTQTDLETCRIQLKAKNPTDVPEAKLTHSMHVIGPNKTIEIVRVDVKTFICNNDEQVRSILEEKDLVYKPGDDLDYLFAQWYKLAKKDYAYAFDKQFGYTEVWVPSHVALALRKQLKIKLDCEDWAHIIGSYFANGEAPRNTWFVTGGEVHAGYGHQAITAIDSELEWHFMNSTQPSTKHDDLKKFVTLYDSKNVANFKRGFIYWSYNDQLVLHRFDTEAAKKSYEKYRGDVIAIG